MTDDTNITQKAANEEMKSAENGTNSFVAPFRLTLDKRIDMAIMGAIVLYGVFIIIESSKIKTGLIPDPLTSRGMPYIAGSSLVILGIALIVLRLKTWSDLPGNLDPGEGHEDEEGYPASWIRAVSIFVTAWVSVLLLSTLGYLIATPLFIFVSLWAMGMRTLSQLILFPVLYTLLTWYSFSQSLGFNLPLGFLAPFFRSLGLTP